MGGRGEVGGCPGVGAVTHMCMGVFKTFVRECVYVRVCECACVDESNCMMNLGNIYQFRVC